MTRAVCLQHVAFEGPGAFASLLARRGYRLEPRLVPRDGLPDDAGEFLLVMGGPMSVNDPDPWIAEEIEFIKLAVQRGVPLIGVCLGAQLLARALGATVRPGPGVEIGMTPARLTEDGRKDRVFGTFPATFEVFQWHGEGFDLPTGAVSLAQSDLFPCQAFRYDEGAYGLLFHLEMERPGAEALCRECPDDLRRAGLDAAALLARAAPHFARQQEWADRLIARLAPPAR